MPRTLTPTRPRNRGATHPEPRERLTKTWKSAGGREVEVHDKVRTNDKVVIDVIGRWTKRTQRGNVPFVTGIITSGTHGDREKGDRLSVAAREVRHVR